MSNAMLEHVNVTVSDPRATAQMLCELFGWQVRWQGAAKLGGYTVHVGSPDSYLAVYAYPPSAAEATEAEAQTAARDSLNHIGVCVENLEAVEDRVKAFGFKPYNHGDYEPGRRFYFDDSDGIEFEVVSYQ